MSVNKEEQIAPTPFMGAVVVKDDVKNEELRHTLFLLEEDNLDVAFTLLKEKATTMATSHAGDRIPDFTIWVEVSVGIVTNLHSMELECGEFAKHDEDTFRRWAGFLTEM